MFTIWRRRLSTFKFPNAIILHISDTAVRLVLFLIVNLWQLLPEGTSTYDSAFPVI